MSITVSRTISAIVERSGTVTVPRYGSLMLMPGEDGRYRLEERIGGWQHRGWRPRTADGKAMQPGHVLSRDEAETAVRKLMGLS